jgi:nucleotide-binding universal stress UspA family protein
LRQIQICRNYNFVSCCGKGDFMKVLIAYDGSDSAKDALKDLKQAGLPANTEVLILTVTENWTLILEEQQKDLAAEEGFDYRDTETIKRMHENAQAAFTEAQTLAKLAAENLQEDFPSWRVQHEASPGFVPWGILEKANEYKPDLIVIGSHGRSLLGRVVLGSVSLKVLSESPCSVRIGRSSPGRTWDDDSPLRIVIGIDGSHDSMLAVDAIASRAWRQDSAVRLVTAVEPILPPNFENTFEHTEALRELAARKLEATGLHVSAVIRLGEAKKILLEEAEKWGADAIFVGARGHRLMDRILLGSVSYAVSARANCTVEVVRDKGEQGVKQ